jgi:PHD/YefM family antitoxin component YafN of YafNO toxin-antitoxin module
MFDVSRDIHSLTDFKTNTLKFLTRLRRSQGAVLLTVNGKAEVAIMSAATFQNVLERLEELDALKAVREGLADVDAGRTRPAEEFFAELRKKHRRPRRDG